MYIECKYTPMDRRFARGGGLFAECQRQALKEIILTFKMAEFLIVYSTVSQGKIPHTTIDSIVIMEVMCIVGREKD